LFLDLLEKGIMATETLRMNRTMSHGLCLQNI
jgi:hypothetical protein